MPKFLIVALMLFTITIPVMAVDEDTASNNELALATSLPKDEVLWLTGDSGKFLSLQRGHLAKERRGIAILLPDIATSIINPDYIEPLRHSLNSVGWGTVSVMPAPQQLLQSKDSASDYTNALVERVNAALTWGKKNYRYSVLIVQGRQMAYLIESQTKQHLQPIDAIVLINAKPAFTQATTALSKQFPDQQRSLSEQLTALNVPLLDINQTDRSGTTPHLPLRAALAAKQQHPNYRQVKFLARDNYVAASKSIYGWLTSIGLK